MKGRPDEMPMLMKSTSPLATWVRASGPPLNGTWTALNPAASRNRSAAQWVALPTPADANVNEPFLAASTNSLRVLIPFAGEITVTFGTLPKRATPERSRPAS